MIQFYINNRPVPRAIARSRLQTALPYESLADIQKMLTNATKCDGFALKKCAFYGVSVERRP